jgi:hypothetical protein
MTDGVPSPAAPRFFGRDRIVGAARAQRSMWSEASCQWLRRPLPSARHAERLGAGRRFALRRGSSMSVLVPIVVFAQFVDVLLCQAALQIFVADSALRWTLHALLLFVSLWAVVWAVSLRSALRHVDHVLAPHALTLAVGLGQLCRIPLAEIAGVHLIDHTSRRGGHDWYDAHQLRPRDVTLFTALDKPTLLIGLAPGAHGAGWTRNGVRRPLKRWIGVYVDDPAAMRAAVAAALPGGSVTDRTNRTPLPV